MLIWIELRLFIKSIWLIKVDNWLISTQIGQIQLKFGPYLSEICQKLNFSNKNFVENVLLHILMLIWIELRLFIKSIWSIKVDSWLFSSKNRPNSTQIWAIYVGNLWKMEFLQKEVCWKKWHLQSEPVSRSLIPRYQLNEAEIASGPLSCDVPQIDFPIESIRFRLLTCTASW